MSKEVEIVQALREAVNAASGCEALTRPRALREMRAGQVLILADKLERSPATRSERRWTLTLVLVVAAKWLEETASAPSNLDALERVRTVLEAIDDAAALKAGGSLGIEDCRRGDVTFLTEPSGREGMVSGGVFPLVVQWRG